MDKPILITGATGFVGFHVARALTRAGKPFRALVRPASNTSALAALGADLTQGDLLDPASLSRACDGCGAVIHLGGAADVADLEVNRRVNVDGTANLAAACDQAGVGRLLFFSTNCAVRELQDAYGQTKLQAEQLLREFKLDLRIFRPAMMYGEGSREFATFVHTVARTPLVPVPGDGEHLLRPIFIDDAVAAALAAVELDGLGGRVYDIIGPEPITLNALIQLTARHLGKRRRPLHIPLKLIFWGAVALGKVWRHPVVTPDQVLGFAQDTTGDPGSLTTDLGVTPRGMEQGMEALFTRTDWRRFFDQV